MSDQELAYPALPQQDTLVSADRSSAGMVAMILGIASLVIGGPLLAIPAIILGVKGRRLAAAGAAHNGNQATVGLVTGSISVAMFCAVMLFLAIRAMA